MDINLNKFSETIRDLSVRYAQRKPAEAMIKAAYKHEHLDYWFTFDALNAEVEDVLENGHSLNEYSIAKIHSGLRLPHSVRVSNSRVYADLLVRPDLSLEEGQKAKLLKPSDFNVISEMYANAAVSDLMEYTKVDIKLATAFEEQYFLIEGKGAINYTEESMPFVVIPEVGALVTDKVVISGIDFKEELTKYLKHQFAGRANG